MRDARRDFAQQFLRRADVVVVVFERHGEETVEHGDALRFELIQNGRVHRQRGLVNAHHVEAFGGDARQHVGEEARHPRLQIGLHKIGMDDRAHVRVDVGHVNARGQRPLHLRVDLHGDGLGFGVGVDRVLPVMEVTFVVEQTAFGVTRRDGSPAVAVPFGVERRVDAHIHRGILAAHLRRGGEPRTRDHHRPRSDRAEFPQVFVSLDGRLAHADVVGVDDDEAVGVGAAEFFEERVGGHGLSFASSDERVVLQSPQCSACGCKILNGSPSWKSLPAQICADLNWSAITIWSAASGGICAA
ncbi:MAG: hypothetical protein PGMFKBFP_03425 [Anaerolineales bacterium]|nr:hypothetical protein [Anaerolineales bacterium]